MITFRLHQTAAPRLLVMVVLLALGASSTTMAQASAGGAVVIIATEISAKSERLTLGDVAEIVSADEQMKARLTAIELGYAPDVGAVRQVTLDKIILAINAAGFPPHSVEIQGAAVVIVRRATQIIDPAYVREAVERAVLNDPRAMGAAARIARLDLPATIEVPAGATEVRAAIGGGRDLFSPFTATIEIWADGRVLRRLNVTAQAEAFALVMVLTRDLAAGARVREEDVTIEMRRLTRAVSAYVRDVKALRGGALKRALGRGEPLTTDVMIAEITVRSGDPVRIIGESGLVYVEVKGEARSAGRIGDRIQVKNVQSGILLQAVIEDEGLVRVRF